MNKPMIGLLAGALLGVIDGATAWFTPDVRSQMMGILIGSTVKGALVGVAAGFFARKVGSMWMGIAFGLLLGLLFAYLIAAMPDPANPGKHYYVEIMVPGSIVGAIVGFITQYYPRPTTSAASVR